MNSLNTLYFPATAINSPRLYPIFLLFQNVHLLSPVEDGKESPDSFIKSGFCQVHTPCPLGQERNRFLRLVADIKSGTDDYAAQLSALTLAAMTGVPTQGEESERSIIRSLHGTQELPREARAREELEKLWQARLVLAIGELLDQEEEEISLNLAELVDEEKVLFKELQGEDDKEEEENPFAELTRLEGSLRVNSAGNVKKRYKAWRTLFLAGDMAECEIFLTSGKDSGDILLETYQQQTGQQAPLVASLELPALVGWTGKEAHDTVHAFTTKNSPFLTAMNESFAELTGQTSIPVQQLDLAAPLLSLADAWEKLLAADFPAERFGRIPASFYLLPGLPCATLVGKTTGSPRPGNNGLLAVIG
ncbi:MAG: hypothetical protein KJ630_02300 [Proteobacteria bacterium]|nr:hypothetical protein [Pseudomonadota bacterium]